MQFAKVLTRRNAGIAAAVAAILALLGFQPVTRNLIAVDAICMTCHLEWEFSPTARLSASKPHKATAEGGQASCVDCHLPKGVVTPLYVYTHFFSLTDLLGHTRAIAAERVGEYVPMRAKTAHRVRELLAQRDSSTCRSCHNESEIKLNTERGKNAHELALKDKKTCIDCHYNLVHRSVDPRIDAAKTGGEAGMKGAQAEAKK